MNKKKIYVYLDDENTPYYYDLETETTTYDAPKNALLLNPDNNKPFFDENGKIIDYNIQDSSEKASQLASMPISNFINLNEYDLQELIGEGSFSKVYKVIEKTTGKTFAAKISKNRLEDIGTDLITNLRREISIMMQMNHPSIINFVGYSPINFKQKAKPVIITELLNKGSLNNILNLERQGLSPKNWNDTKKLINIFGIASAMSYLHSKNIIHRDLKPANVLEDDSYYPKIADFGISKKQHFNQQSIKESIQSVKGIKGTPAFMAPESFESYEYVKACDVYAFSMVVYEMMSLLEPYSNLTSSFLAFKVFNDYRPDLKYVTSECYRDLISRCWSKDPKDRPTFDQIIFELKRNKDFILDGMDMDEYYDYIEMVDKSDNSFLFNDKEEPNKLTNTSNTSKQIKQSDNLVKVCEVEKSSPVLGKLKSKKKFNKLSIECKNFFENARFVQNKSKPTIIIQSNEINNIIVNDHYKSHHFIELLKFFDEVLIEIDTSLKQIEKVFLCISRWISKSVKINVSISNIENIVGFLKDEKLPINVTLQSSFKSIDIGSLSGCYSITQISIPSSVTEICAYAFSECSYLTNISIPSSVTDIGVGAFRMCVSLKEVTLPSSLKNISDYIFLQCNSLSSISIPSSIKEIGRHSFSGCSMLAKMQIPSSVNKIGNSAFLSCSSLKKLKIPSSVIKIENNTFDGCSSLKKITFTSSLKEIGDYSFSECISLNEVVIPDSVIKIGSYAFFGCSSLAQVSIPFSVEKIGDNAFNGCASLQKISIPKYILIIKSNTFEKCTSLKKISLDSYIKEIENDSFSGCSSLKNIEIPSYVTKIGSNAFSGCSSLENIIFGSLKYIDIIESNTFNGCSSLKEIVLPLSIEKIEWGAFNGCKSLSKISLPSDVRAIGHYAFNDCSSLKEMTIPSSVTEIKNNTFSNCTSLENVSVPNCLKKIGDNAFYGCLSLKQMTIPKSVTSIGKSAFDKTPLFSSISSLPKSMKSNTSEEVVSLNSFEPIRTLGRGAYGKVMLVRCKLDYRLYAMKSISKKLIENTNNVQAAKLERDILFRNNHLFVVSARYSFQTPSKIFIVLDYVAGGDLHTRIKQEVNFSESRARLYAAEIAEGIGYLHSLGYIYRDLKPENILIGSDGYIKISDMGFSRKNKELDTVMTFCGTPQYISPEMIQGKPYNKDIDWWSFGIVVFEMLTGLPPFNDENVKNIYRMILYDEVEFPSYISPVAKQFVSQLLEKDPARRLGSGDDDVEAIKNHPFFDGLDWFKLNCKIITPEWIPKDESEEEKVYFDNKFTYNDDAITFEDPALIDKKTQDEFVGFTCSNKEYEKT